MKLLLKLAVVLVVLVLVLVVVVLAAVDRLARVAIERGGTHALGVETTLRAADVGILGGTFQMNGLKVANPPGFDRPHFLRLESGGMNVTLGTLREDLVELPRLGLDDIDVNIERRGGEANYRVIADNLKRLETSGDAPSDPSEDGRRFVIREVDVRNVNVHVDLLPAGGALTRLDVPIERITLTNVGSGEDRGMNLDELVSVIVKAILAAVVEKGGDILPADLIGDLSGALAELESLQALGVTTIAELGDVAGRLEDATDRFDERLDELKKPIEEIEKIGDDFRKGLDGFRDLGKKKDDS